jgi:hypothetical protein
MSVNRQIQANTFQKGMMLDASDMIMPADTVRFGQNIRLVNRSGSSYVLSNLQGTESSFTLTPEFVPVAAQEFAGVLYIISWRSTDGMLELGSYPSPNYSNISNPSLDVNVYRPLNNLNGGAFRTTAFGTSTKPVIQKLEIQPDFDESVNMVFTIVGKRPRIVNTKFVANNNGTTMSVLADRSSGGQDAANSNTYTDQSVDKETSLILFSRKILGIDLQGVQSGGKLKAGNYQYVFYYMSEDFNRTAIVGQSSTCQVAFGTTGSTMRGGDETQETNRRVHLRLTNIDTDFRYLKAYALYSSGQEGLQQQYLELVQPIEISGTQFDFYHTGFEELREVSIDEVDIDYASIDSASASTQLAGYYFLGDIRQRTVDFTSLRSAALDVSPIYAQREIPIATAGLPGYTDPLNVYNYLGYMGKETYPLGIVFVMNDGSLSPAFPTRGVDFSASGNPSNTKGLVTFPFSNVNTIYNSSNFTIAAKYMRFQVGPLLNNNFIRDNTIGFFFVRGERRANALTQGLLIPTIKAPAVEAPDGAPGSSSGYGANTSAQGAAGGGYYVSNANAKDDTNVFKRLINLDSIVEPFLFNRQDDSDDRTVLDGDGGIATNAGYMPVYLRENHGGTYTGGVSAMSFFRSEDNTPWLRHWALLSGEALANEAEYVTSLQRENMGIHQLAKVVFKVFGQVLPIAQGVANNKGVDNFGCHYNMWSLNPYVSEFTPKLIKKTVFVPAESLATGSDFVSKYKVALVNAYLGSNSAHFWVNQWYNSYFGVELDPATGQILDATSALNNPVGGNGRIGKIAETQTVDAVFGYNNLNQDVPAGFLVNIYPQNQILTPDQLYPSTDNITYRQISKRFTWEELGVGSNVFVDVFGGDCYISQVSRKLSHAPVRDASLIQTEPGKRWNIDSGLIVTWWQESKYNLHLRQPKQFDASETERRSFFPFRNGGDPIAYRKYRLPETAAHSPGYSVVMPPKNFFGVSPNIPFERTRFMNRIYHSEKHIPNAFRNGYRSFLETSFRDYDAGMGSIVALFNHRGMLLVIFEHGIGITAVEQRVETGRDAAGAVFIEPTSVLPPTLTYLSKEIGCQDTLSLVQTPGAVYGVDRAKDKIWRVADGLNIISDESVSSWLIDNPAINPRSGYDFENNEVIFNTNNWCLCFTEGLDKFTSFYTFTSASFFARRNKELYSFISNNNNAHRHNSESVYTIYGSNQDVIVEVVINKDLSVAKVIDYLNLISNEVPPSKLEVYSYNQDVAISPVIQVAGLNQYTRVEFGIDPLTDEPTMLYRDKKYVIQIPYRQDYNTGSDADRWGIEGRIRDKYLIVRLTYVTDKPLELASVLNFYRYSPS